MADLIDKENTKAVLVDWFLNTYCEKRGENGYRLNSTQWDIVEKMKCLIEKIPPTDTERHAHWTRINNVLSQCSNCKTTILRCDTDNYCSHCGCKMDEVVE